MAEIKVLHSLHRPYHCPLWIVKWVCCFYAKRAQLPKGYFLFDELNIDMYFKLLEWLMKYYPIGCVGIPSIEAISAVIEYFDLIPLEERALTLKSVLVKSKREKGVETQIYSTYKAVSYYNNLAKDKLQFISNQEEFCCWDYSSFRHFRFFCGILKNDRKAFINQLLKYDGHFLLSQVFLQKYAKKYGLNIEDIVFDFMQKNYPIPRFDFVSHSHQNYYVVRKHWIEQLGLITPSGTPSSILNRCIIEDVHYSYLKNDILLKISQYIDDIRNKSVYLKHVDLFYKSYKSRSKGIEDESGFVNLYDICMDMKMTYARFNSFIEDFYETERMKKNIFFINIVSTIDQRKRFYVRNTPVLKIKIS